MARYRGFKRTGSARIPRLHTFTGGLEHNNIVHNFMVTRYKSRIDLFGDANIAIEVGTTRRRYIHVSVDKGLRKANNARSEVDGEHRVVHGIF